MFQKSISHVLCIGDIDHTSIGSCSERFFPVTHSKQPALLKAELFVYAEGGCVGGFYEECEAVRFCAVGIDEMRNGGCG